MKKIYIPTKDELETIEYSANGQHLYKYVLTKTVEKMLAEGELVKNADEDLLKIPELVQAICYIYPQEIMFSDDAKNNPDLFYRLLCHELRAANSINSLDYLCYATKDVQYNPMIVLRALQNLNQKLKDNPTYRFTYRESNLLNAIFATEHKKFAHYNEQVKDLLMYIDPIYLVKFSDDEDEEITLNGEKLQDRINAYSFRYGIEPKTGFEYAKSDILRKPDEKVKKLIKFINRQ